MLFSTIGQVHVFLWMVGAGLLVGTLYSLAEGLRRLLEAGFWLTLLSDVLFGLCTALILILALVTANYGQLRLYELPVVLLGFFLYQQGIRPLIHGFLHRVRRCLRHIFVRINNFRPIKVIFK